MDKAHAKVKQVFAERTLLVDSSQHPFITTLFSAFQTEHHLYLLMDFCAGALPHIAAMQLHHRHAPLRMHSLRNP